MTELRDDPSMLEDVWIQVLLIFTIIAGLFCVNFFIDLLVVRSGGEPARRASTQGSGSSSGRQRIVDAAASPGSDFSDLASAIASASDGDVLSLKPGTYRAGVAISKSITLTGAGGSPDDVVLSGAGSRALAVAGGRVSIGHLTISQSGSGDAVAVGGGSLSLMDARVKSSGDGLRVVDADLEIGDSRIEARTGVLAEGKSRARILRSRIDAESAAVNASGLGTELRLERAELRGRVGPTIDAGRFAKLVIQESSLSHGGVAAIRATSGAEVTVSASTLSDIQGCAVVIDRGIVFLDGDQIRRVECGIAFHAPGSLRVVDSRFSDLAGPGLRMKREFEKDVILSGSGNTGIDLYIASR